MFDLTDFFFSLNGVCKPQSVWTVVSHHLEACHPWPWSGPVLRLRGEWTKPQRDQFERENPAWEGFAWYEAATRYSKDLGSKNEKKIQHHN